MTVTVTIPWWVPVVYLLVGVGMIVPLGLLLHHTMAKPFPWKQVWWPDYHGWSRGHRVRQNLGRYIVMVVLWPLALIEVF